jgi:hypothetical protein
LERDLFGSIIKRGHEVWGAFQSVNNRRYYDREGEGYQQSYG